MIYATYNKSTGEYGGSGVTQIDDDEWGSTSVLPDPPAGQYAFWNGDGWYYSPHRDPSNILTRREFALAAKREGIISHAEAVDWATQKELPQIVQNVFSQLPQKEREAAEFEALTANNIVRSNPLFVSLKDGLGFNDEQVDALFSRTP